MYTFVIIIVSYACICGAFLMLGLLGKWIVGPMDRAARDVAAPTQFFMTDIVGLVLLLQIVTLLPAWIMHADADESNRAYAAGAFCWLAAGALWWASIESLSRAGVRRRWKRVLFSIFVLPLALASTFTAVVGNLVLIFWVTEQQTPSLLVLLPVGLNVVIATAAYGGRLMTLWVLANPVVRGRKDVSGDSLSPPPASR